MNDTWTELAAALRSSQEASPDERLALLERVLGREKCEELGVFRLPEGFVLSVVVPIFNENKTVATVIDRIVATGLPCEIILVDDGSTDGTSESIQRWKNQPQFHVLSLETNQGKGAALRAGFAAATGQVVAIQDADLEYNPTEFWKLLAPIIQDRADVVYGSRFLSSRQHARSLWHSLGNQWLTRLSNWRTKLNLTDMETCYKLVRCEVLQKIAPTLNENRFGIEPEITAKLSRVPGVRFLELPISYSGRTYAQGKKIKFRDGFRALWCIARY